MFWVGLIAAIGLSSCGVQEAIPPHAHYESTILGDWRMAAAFRNDVQTRLLDSTYFHFTSGQVLDTNLPLPGRSAADQAPVSYALLTDTLRVTLGDEAEQLFYILQLDSQRLVMQTSILDYRFRFDLERKP